MPTLAEDLLLLLLEDETGRLITDGTSTDNALAGAVLVDLVNAGRVRAEGKKLHVMDTSSLDEPVLEDGLARMSEKAPMHPQRAVELLDRHVRQNVLDRLVARGLVRREKSKVLGLFPRSKWPAVDSAHEDAIRAKLTEVLVDGAEPDARSGALISLLYAIDAVHKVVEGDKRSLKAKAKKISQGDWASTAVRQAIESVNSAVTAAIVATSIGASTS